MKIKTVLAAAVIASTSTMSFAGNDIAPVQEAEVFMPAPAAGSSSGGKYIVPIVLCLVLCTALGSSSGT